MNPEPLVEVKSRTIIFFIFFLLFSTYSIAQHWKKIEESSHPRVESINAVVDGKIFIFSGFTEFTNNILKISSTTEAFNPDHVQSASGPWKLLKNMPIPVTHTGAVVVDKTIWIAGGFEGNDPGVSVNAVQIYDTNTDSWSRGPELPEKMASHAIVKSGHYIHVFGGLKPDRKTDNGAHYVLNLNNIKDGWKAASGLPSPRNHLSAASVGGKIYAIGGQHGHDGGYTDLKLVHEYDPLTNKWSRKADLPIDRSHFEPGTITLDGKIIIVGGRNQNNKNILDNITEFDPKTNKWKELPPLPVSLLAPNAKIINGKLYVTHGGKFWDSPLKSAYVKVHEGSQKDSIGFSPAKIEETVDTKKTLSKRAIIWSLNKKITYKINEEQLPEWLKINKNEAKGETDPEGKFINIEINANGLAPGKYFHNVYAEATGYKAAVLPVVLHVVDNDTNIIRINSGGEAISFNGLNFSKDDFFTGSKSYANSKEKEVNGTDLDKIYLSERSPVQGENSFAYNIPVKTGDYMVRLHFAEIYWGAQGGGQGGNGKRVFNVNIEKGPAELINFDIFKEVGPMSAIVKEFIVVVNDGILNIDFSASKDQPKVSAIEVIPYKDNVQSLSFYKKYDSLSLFADSSTIIKNLVYTSTKLEVPVQINITDDVGKTISWVSLVKVDGKENLSGTELDFKVETTGLKPGKYKANIIASAKDYLLDECKVILNVLTKEEVAPPAIEVVTEEIAFISVYNQVSEPYLLKIKNISTTPLQIKSAKIEGEQSSEFEILNLKDTALEIPGNQSFELEVQYIPNVNKVSEASLVIKHNDPTKGPISVSLHGMVVDNSENGEPTLKEITNTLGIGVDVGFSSLFSDPQIFPVGDELIAPLFKKAGKDEVRIEVLASYAPQYPLHFGILNYELNGAEQYDTTNLLVIADSAKNRLAAKNEKEIIPDPSSNMFVFFVKMSEQVVHSFDSLNSSQGDDFIHAVRVYPFKDSLGIHQENHFILAFDVDADGDFQDVLIRVSNVVPVTCLGSFEIQILEINNPSCGEYGSIILDVSDLNNTVEFKIGEEGTYQTSGTFFDLIPGTYTIYARDSIESCENFLTFKIEEQQSPLEFSIATQPVSCENYNDGWAKIDNVVGGLPPFEYYWNEQISDSNFIEGLFPGTYTITVMDAAGCKNSKEYVINKSNDCATKTIYRETFSNAVNEEQPVDATKWAAFKGTEGREFIINHTSESKIYLSPQHGKLKEHAVNAGTTLDSIKGYLSVYDREAAPVIIFTEEFPVDLKKYNINSIKWVQGHSSINYASRLVISIDGTWYINKKQIKNSQSLHNDSLFSQAGEEVSVNFSLSGSEWEIFNFIPGTSMYIHEFGEVERVKSLNSLPKGILDAFGIYTSLNEPGSLRFDSFTILAENIDDINEVAIDFKAQIKDDNYAFLLWNINSHIDLKDFVVEKSLDNNAFTEIGNVPATENNGQIHEYNFKDPQPLFGTAFYRIKYIDINGLDGYSEVLPLHVEGKRIAFLVYPNPIVNNYVLVEVHGLNSAELVNVKIVDVFGRTLVEQQLMTNEIGSIKEQINFSSMLSAGIYNIIINSSQKPLQQQLLVR